MGKLLDGIKAIAEEHGHNFASIEDVEAWCREQRGKPALAPLPGEVKEALRRFAQDCPTCTDTVHNHISDLTRRLAEAEAEAVRAKQRHINAYQDMDEVLACGLRKQIKMSRKIIDEKSRAEAAEATVANLEGELQRMRQAMGGYKP